MPPVIREGEIEIEMCYHCPDATIRNDRLTPVCIADWISLPGSHAAQDAIESTLARAACTHRGETKFLKSGAAIRR